MSGAHSHRHPVVGAKNRQTPGLPPAPTSQPVGYLQENIPKSFQGENQVHRAPSPGSDPGRLLLWTRRSKGYSPVATAGTSEVEPQPGLPASPTHLASSCQLARSEVQAEGDGGDLTEAAGQAVLPGSAGGGGRGGRAGARVRGARAAGGLAHWLPLPPPPPPRPSRPEPLESQNLRGRLRPGHFGSPPGSGESPGDRPSRPDPPCHIPEQAASLATAQVQPQSGSFLPGSPPRPAETRRARRAGRGKGKEGRGRQGGGEATAARVPGVRDGAPRRPAPAPAPCPPPNAPPRPRAGPSQGSPASPGSRRARLTLGRSEEPRAQHQQRREQERPLASPPRSHVCR
ncbi:translation initiation factor IF-2-like [Panthera uncia]|uniref:translation initiation factor IF-2-like n=1 Tax=Panthera uncia TaxID=29064 RepID=UPI0020FF8A3D|nr:translation initiation factor IF-2-like [Panthera uncia]